MQTIANFFGEIWKRWVVQIGALYLGIAWILQQITLALAQTFQLPTWVAQASVLFLFVAFPVVLILAWTREPRAANASAPILAIIPPIPIEAVAPINTSSFSGKPSICVLPFANRSDDLQQEYFSDGITEDIITDLSKVSALFVTARNTAFTYKARSEDVRHIARQLGVSHILEGSVRKAGGQLRITADLIDGVTGNHVWADRYDRDLNDIFALQDEISEAIVNALRLKLLPDEKKAIERRGTDSVEAYTLYLMARQEYVDGSDGDPRRDETIIRLCERATEIDPKYARAWALMAVAQVASRLYRGGSGDGGLAAAEKALSVDVNLAEAHAVKARVLSESGDQREATNQISIALALDSRSWEVNRSAGLICFKQQRLEDAIRYWEEAVALEEKDFASAGMLITCYTAANNQISARRVAEMTIARCEKVLAVERNNGHTMGYGSIALAVVGKAERAKEWMNRALLIDPDNIAMRYNFACSLAAHLKEANAALELLRPAFAKMAVGLLNHAKIDPDLDSLRDDPQFKSMIAQAEARLTGQQS